MNFAEEIFELITMSRVLEAHSHTHSVFLASSLCYFSFFTPADFTQQAAEKKKEVKYIKASRAFLAKGKSTFCLYLSIQLLFTSRAVRSGFTEERKYSRCRPPTIVKWRRSFIWYGTEIILNKIPINILVVRDKFVVKPNYFSASEGG